MYKIQTQLKEGGGWFDVIDLSIKSANVYPKTFESVNTAQYFIDNTLKNSPGIHIIVDIGELLGKNS